MFALLSRAAALLGAGALLGVLINAAHPHGVPLASFTPPSACAVPVPTSPAGPATASVDVLSMAEVAKLCADPRALIVDARDANAFAEGHVAGAIHLPCASSRSAASAAMDLLTGKDILIVYGDGTDDAKPVAAEMLNRGSRRDVKYAVLAGGFQAWNRGGFACASGPCTDCAGTVARP